MKVFVEQKSLKSNIITFRFKNETSNELYLLKWNTPFDHFPSDCCNLKREDGSVLTYTGPIAKRQFDSEASLKNFLPKEELVVDLDLTLMYTVSTHEIVTIELLNDLFYKVPDNQKQPTSIESLEPVAVSVNSNKILLRPSNKKFIEVPSELDNYNVYDESKVRASLNKIDEVLPENIHNINDIVSAIPRCPKPVLCYPNYSYSTSPNNGHCYKTKWVGHPLINKYLQGDKEEIHNAFVHLHYKYIDLRGGFKLYSDPLYIKWFGERRDYRVLKVSRTLNRIMGNDYCHKFMVLKSSSHCAPDVFAFTYPREGDLDIFVFCSLFFKAPSSGIDSKAGTWAHELSHHVADTLDHKYGYEACKLLASSYPDLAIENADNYQYYIEERLGI